MKIEHFALNVADPAGMAAWYAEHLGMRIVVAMSEPPYGHFLADDGDASRPSSGQAPRPGSGQATMLEIYHNPADAIPDYARQAPARLHLAFLSADPQADAARLIAAGATHVEDVPLDGGGLIVTVRDPWGLPIQMVRRAEPMV